MDDLDYLIKKSLSNQAEPDYYLLMRTKQAALAESEKSGRTMFVMTCVLSIATALLAAVAANIFLPPLIAACVNFYSLVLLNGVFAVFAVDKVNGHDKVKINLLSSSYALESFSVKGE